MHGTPYNAKCHDVLHESKCHDIPHDGVSYFMDRMS